MINKTRTLVEIFIRPKLKYPSITFCYIHFKFVKDIFTLTLSLVDNGSYFWYVGNIDLFCTVFFITFFTEYMLVSMGCSLENDCSSKRVVSERRWISNKHVITPSVVRSIITIARALKTLCRDRRWNHRLFLWISTSFDGSITVTSVSLMIFFVVYKLVSSIKHRRHNVRADIYLKKRTIH